VSTTIAAGGKGKTSLLIVEVLELVTGFALISDYKGPPVPVWYWNGEDPIEEIQRRIQAACFHYKITEADLGGRLFVNSGRDMPLIIAKEHHGDLKISEPVVNALVEKIKARQVALMAVDPFVRSHRISENDNVKVNHVVEQWAHVADRAYCACELAHHIRKTGNAEAEIDDARGAGSLIDGVRDARVLNWMSAADAEHAGVDNRRLYVSVTNGKANLAPPSDKRTWFTLESVSLGNGDDVVTPSDQVGVAVKWTWPSPFDDVPHGTLEEFQNRLGVGEWRADQQSKKWAGNLLADILEWDISDKATKKQVAQILSGWRTGGAIKVETRRDDARKPRKFFEKGTPA
jgi:hypothetical protein